MQWGGFLTSLVIIDKFDQGQKKEKWKNFSGGEHQISGWKPADNAVSQKNQMHLCPYIFKSVNIESWVQMSLNHEKNLENVVKLPLKIDEKP